MNSDIIKQLIIAQLVDAQVSVHSHDNVHFAVHVSYAGFAQQSLLQRERVINEILKSHILSGEIHALAIKTSVL